MYSFACMCFCVCACLFNTTMKAEIYNCFKQVKIYRVRSAFFAWQAADIFLSLKNLFSCTEIKEMLFYK